MRGEQITRTGDEPEGYVHIATMNLAEFVYQVAHQQKDRGKAIEQIEDTIRVNIDAVRGTPKMEEGA